MGWRPDPIEFFHYRDRDDFEVDIVLDFGSAALAGIEVKAAATVVEADFCGLRNSVRLPVNGSDRE
jgi:uncharacterized protein